MSMTRVGRVSESVVVAAESSMLAFSTTSKMLNDIATVGKISTEKMVVSAAEGHDRKSYEEVMARING